MLSLSHECTFKLYPIGIAAKHVRRGRSEASASQRRDHTKHPAVSLAEIRGAKMPQTAAKNVRVLAVDDSPAFLQTLCSFLEGDPMVQVVATAHSGREALSAAALWRPHVVLMDLQMPEMNGLEATTKLHEHFPELPVIILTAHDLPTLRDACKKHGVYAFVTKAQLSQRLPSLLIGVPHHATI